MAQKTIFQKIDRIKYKDLGYDDTCLETYGIPTDVAGTNIQDMLFTENYGDFADIQGTLENETTDDLTTGFKKAFVAPGMNVSADRVKLALREHKIVVTNDYELADLLVVDDSLIDDHDSTFRTTKMLHHKTNMYIIKEGIAEDYYNTTGVWTVFCDKIKTSQNLYNIDYESAAYDLYGVSGLAIELTEKIKNKEMDVVNVETVMMSSASKQPLTVELIDQLDSMLSGGSDDKQLAGAIIPTIDYRTKPHLLWKLAGFLYQRIDYDFNRNKDVQYWAEKAKIRQVSRKSAQDAILHFESIGKLSNETFKYLEPIVRSEISIHNRELYVFKVQIKPEYRKYFKNKTND